MAGRTHVRELLAFLGIDPNVLDALRAEGLFEEDYLEAELAEELRVATCLMQDLGVNAAGVEVILHMRRRMLVLQSRTERSLRRLLEDVAE